MAKVVQLTQTELDRMMAQLEEDENASALEAITDTAVTYRAWYDAFRKVGFTDEQSFLLVRDQAKTMMAAWSAAESEDEDYGDGL
jgi:hypothetical protein